MIMTFSRLCGSFKFIFVLELLLILANLRSGSTLQIRKPAYERRGRIAILAGEEGQDISSDVDEHVQDETSQPKPAKVFNVKKNRIRDNRDTLPYYVDVISPPPRRLGVFSMDKNTASGDLLEVKFRMFEVRRVRCLYKYRSGIGYVMVKKGADVVEATRVLEEAYLNRVMQIQSANRVSDDSI